MIHTFPLCVSLQLGAYSTLLKFVVVNFVFELPLYPETFVSGMKLKVKVSNHYYALPCVLQITDNGFEPWFIEVYEGDTVSWFWENCDIPHTLHEKGSVYFYCTVNLLGFTIQYIYAFPSHITLRESAFNTAVTVSLGIITNEDPFKQIQHVGPRLPNFVGHNMLGAFGHPV